MIVFVKYWYFPKKNDQVYVSPGCDLARDLEMVTIFARDGINMVLVGVIMAVVSSVILILIIALCCRHKTGLRQYEIVSALAPGKYLSSGKNGWRGESDSDIPSALFPKHVQVISSQFLIFCSFLNFSTLGTTCLRKSGICKRLWVCSMWSQCT